MRFDLEIDIVDVLTSNGLNNLSNNLYSSTSIIEPMQWDTKSLSYIDNIGNINTDKFNNLKRIPNNLFLSGLSEDSSVSVSDIIDSDGSKSIVVTGGEYYSSRYKTDVSSIKTIFRIDFSNNYYSIKLDNDYDISTIEIFTLSFDSNGSIYKNKIYNYVEYDNISIDLTLSNKKEQYCYTIYNNTIYLNSKEIIYNNELIGKVVSDNKMFALSEFPATNVSILNIDANDFEEKNGIITIKKDTSRNIVTGEDIIASYSICPIIIYKNKEREQRPDLKYFDSGIDSKSLDFDNGSICIYSNIFSTSIPSKVDIKSIKTEAKISENITIESSIYNTNDIPIPNKEIKMSVISNNIKWQNNSYSISTKTGISGIVKNSIKGNAGSIGNYIQKEWMNNVTIDGQLKGQIIIPYKLDAINDIYSKSEILNGIYLYYIQSDDPILGKISSNVDEVAVDEYYTSADIRDYILTGRKIALVKLINTNIGIQSVYKKPSNIEVVNDYTVTYRDLFVRENNTYPISATLDGSLIQTYTYDVLGNKYKDGTLPYNTLNIYEKTFKEVTIITYDDPFTLSNNDLNGAWLASDKLVSIQAEYNDNAITIKSDILNIKLKSIESELPFLLSGYFISGYDTKVSNIGYLTPTEYNKNPFGLRAFSYYCIYSDCINKKCIHKDVGYRKYFILDKESIGCIHTPEYDSTISSELRCPGVNAKLINPFVLQVE